MVARREVGDRLSALIAADPDVGPWHARLVEADTRDSAEAALDALRREGSPVIRAEDIPEIVSVGWRRWNSFERRNGKRSSGIERRVEDLAKGLRDNFERDPRLAGPLIEDYRHLARTLATAFGDAH